MVRPFFDPDGELSRQGMFLVCYFLETTMNTIEKLKAAFAQTSQGEWLVCPTLRPDLDDDPMAEYTIKNHQAGLMHRYFEADIDSDELAKVHKENGSM